ncbi:MAG: acetolactate synthase small subunit [Eubacteriales bacterium]|nr:acetolactate synthase small subunit [Eubacteriales bacterium]
MEKDQFIVSLLVNNYFGVLTRVASLFSRRGFNIDSLTVGETEDTRLSRMTIVSRGDDYVKDQIVKQSEKLVDVKTAQLMDEDRVLVRELLIIKIGADRDQRSEILEAVNAFRASVIDFAPASLSVELTGEPHKLNAFIEYVRPYGIIELCRTGPTAIGRSGYCLQSMQNLSQEEENHG